MGTGQDRSNLKPKLEETVRRFYNILKTKDSKSYYEMMETSLEIQSVTEFMSQKEKEELYNDVSLTHIKKILPMDDYEIQLYADGKLVRFKSKNKDEFGNQFLFKYTVAPLIDGKQDGEGAFNYLFYLPKNKTQLEVF